MRLIIILRNCFNLGRLLGRILRESEIKVDSNWIDIDHSSFYLRWDNDKIRIWSDYNLVSDHKAVYLNSFKKVKNPDIKIELGQYRTVDLSQAKTRMSKGYSTKEKSFVEASKFY